MKNHHANEHMKDESKNKEKITHSFVFRRIVELFQCNFDRRFDSALSFDAEHRISHLSGGSAAILKPNRRT